MLITAVLTCVVAAQAPTEFDTVFQPERPTEIITASETRGADESPPTITISEPAPNQQLPYGTITFSLIASDETALGKVLLLTDDGRTFEYPLPTGTRNFEKSIPVPTLGAGRHQITARAIDRSGNEDNATVSFTVNDSDNNMSGPDVGITTPATSILTVTPGTNVVLLGWAKDDQQVVSLTWKLQGATIDSGTLAGSNSWRVTLPRLSVGSHTFSIFAKDRSRSSPTRSVTIRVQNNTPPGPGPGPGTGDETSGDIKKDAKKCGTGGGIAAFLLLFGALMALHGRRRIE